MLPMSDVREVEGFRGKFVYNYFVRNEMYQDAGNSRFQGGIEQINNQGQSLIIDNNDDQVDPSVATATIPRFIELDWEEAKSSVGGNIQDLQIGQPGFIKDNKDLINTEGTMNSVIDSQVAKSEKGIRKNLVRKLKLFAHISKNEEDPPQLKASNVLDKLQDFDDIDSSIAEDLLSKLSFADAGFVNEKRVVDRTTKFLDASNFKVEMMLDRRLAQSMVYPMFGKDGSRVTHFENFAKESKKNFALLHNESQRINFELGLKVLPGKVKVPNNTEFEYKVNPVGYIVERQELGADGLFKAGSKKSYVDGSQITKFYDTQIIYNKLYRYKVSAVYAIEFITAVSGDVAGQDDPGLYKCLGLIKSKASNAVVIRTTELVSPAEPDGVMYRYNYDVGKGLLINWQMPVGKQRDIKYFQIFRRKSIKDPFTCIAELDFNDVILRYKGKKIKGVPKTEKVREDRVYKLEFPRTFFNDARFDRDSKFIYAVAAVDAHGLTSGYSAQVEVGFDKFKNRLDLKTISRPGAPKQYPNFFIDPKLDDNFTIDSLTSDAMMNSHKQEIHIYFDPDAVKVKVDGTEDSQYWKNSMELPIIKYGQGGSGSPKYVFNILNVDRQVSRNFTVKILNKRKSLQF